MPQYRRERIGSRFPDFKRMILHVADFCRAVTAPDSAEMLGFPAMEDTGSGGPRHDTVKWAGFPNRLRVADWRPASG